ncbi:reverse transcriptase domain-containing protein [Tanacetum coccineum]|uniref:Reverse transcriptase domain-containing protein n=1 Tax=Tanacetum coccineum TaxID=301880 RepID=A0ABQ5GGT2_9ASTR
MRTRSSSNLVSNSSSNPTTTNPKRHNRRRSKQPFNLEEPLENQAPPVVTMADQRTMAELLRAPTEVYAEAIVVPQILAEHFELKHSLINMMTSDQFFGLEKDNPHDHIRWFNKITSTIKFKDVPNSAIKLMLFPFFLAGAARRWLEKEPPRSILTWEDHVSKFINEFFPPSRTTNLRNEISNFQQKFDESFHEAWDRYKDLLRACPHHGFTELHQLDTLYNALNPADQDSLNSAAGGLLLERSTQDVLTIIENKSKVRNSRNKLIVSQVKSSDVNSSSSSDIAKLTHAVNQQTSVVTTAMTAILKQFQATPPPASVKAVEEICVTCGGAHPYYQCLAADGNTFLEYRDNIQGYVAAAAGPTSSVQKAKPPSQRNYVVHQRDPRHPHIPYPSRMNQEKQKEKDEVQIHKFWQMFKQLHINITLADALILISKYQKMLKILLSNKEKLLELANTPLNENCSAVILKTLPEKLGDPGKFLIPCGFSELKCKALADLGASINFMPLSVWKKLGLPELISTQITLELANRAIYTPAGIARDVFALVGKFTFPADFVIVDYESDPLILNMRHDTSSYSNESHKESINMIDIYNVLSEEYLEDLFSTHLSGNPTFSSHTDLTSPEVIHPLSGNPTPISEPVTKSSSSPTLTSFEESELIWEEFEAYLASDSFPPGNSDPSSPPSPYHNSLSGSTTSSSPSLPISETRDYSLEEFVDELALIESFPPGNNDMTPEDVIRERDYLLNRSPLANYSPSNNLVDTISEMFTDEHALDYSSLPLWDDYDDELFDLETVNDNTYFDPFDSKEKKIKESKLLIDELDLPGSSDFLPFPECDSVFYEDFSKVDALSSTNNEDKDFNPPLYELPFHKEVLGLGALLSFSSKNEEKVFNPRILTSKGVHTSLLPELSHRESKAFKDCPDFEASRARGFCPSFTRASNPQLHFGNPISKSYRLTFYLLAYLINGLRFT